MAVSKKASARLTSPWRAAAGKQATTRKAQQGRNESAAANDARSARESGRGLSGTSPRSASTVAGALMLPLFMRYGVRDVAGMAAIVTAAHGAVIISGGTPIMSALLASLWFGERRSAAPSAALATIVVGLILVGAGRAP